MSLVLSMLDDGRTAVEVSRRRQKRRAGKEPKNVNALAIKVKQEARNLTFS